MELGEEKVLLGTGATPAPWYHPSRATYAMKLVLSVGAFMTCSGGMMLVNKQVTMRLGTPLTVVGIQVRHLGTRLVCQKVLERSRTRCWQMAFTVVVLVSCFFWTLRFGSRRDVIRWSRAVPPLYSLMLATSMIALQYASVGAVTVARNVAPLIALPIDAAFQERIETTMWTWISLVYILAGVLLYMSVDVGVGTSTFGLSFIMLNMFIAIITEAFKDVSLVLSDFVEQDRMLTLSASLIFLYATGAIISPLAAGIIIENYGTAMMFAMIAVAHLLLMLYTVHRTFIRTATRRRSYAYIPRTSLFIASIMRNRRGANDRSGED